MNLLQSYYRVFQSMTGMCKFATIFLIFNGIYYWPLSIQAGFGPQHFLLMLSVIIVGCICCKGKSKAMFWGSLYFLWQLFIIFIHDAPLRWSTVLFSFGLIYTYVGFYNLVYLKKVFTLDVFIEIVRFMIHFAFIVCLLQQMAILAGFRSFPAINLINAFTEKSPLACNSLFQEMSIFARSMLVCYYVYVKCCEIKRGEGRLSPLALLQGEHRWVTLPFLWMMLTMGSATAIICLLAFSLYFTTRKNILILVPLFILVYGFLYQIDNKQVKRSLRVIEATKTLNRDDVVVSDGSAAVRIAPIINSLDADFSKAETWFGHGLDYNRNNNLTIKMTGTLFDDYGFILFIIGYIFSFKCAYKINSLGALFMVMGIGGGLGGNIHYAWELAMIMTVLRYFIDQSERDRNVANCVLHA